MDHSVQVQKTRKPGKIPLTACFTIFGLFFVNLFVGKANIVYHLGLPHLGNVAEFLLMAAASTFLIIAALERETAEKKNNTNPTEVEK